MPIDRSPARPRALAFAAIVLLCFFRPLLPVAATCKAEDMIFPGEQWAEAAPESESLDASQLAAAIDYLRQNSGRDGVRELVIIRNGRMVWHGDDIDKVHGVWSCTKSFTSTTLGLLIEDGKCALDTLAQMHAPEMAASYPQVSLKHLTTMTSGYRAIGDEPHGSYVHGPSGTPFEPAPQPLFAPPGSQYAYWDSAMNMFGLILTRVAGEPLEQLFKRRIADPIGMHAQAWDWGDYATLDGVVVNGGSGNGGKHVTISAREMARFGHLFLNRGRWNDQQLISPQWIEQATSVHVPRQTPWAQPESDIDGRGVYGFNWWTNGTQSNGKRLWPDAPTGTFAASGHNNNKLFVIPKWNMVIVRLGLDQSDGKISDTVWSAFLGKVGQSRMDARAEWVSQPARSTVFPAEHWLPQSPRDLGLAEDQLEAFAKSIGGDGVVIRNGYLVKSWGRPNRRGDWASSAKPVISTLLLFAVQEGKLQSVDDALRPWVRKHWPGGDLIDMDSTGGSTRPWPVARNDCCHTSRRMRFVPSAIKAKRSC